MHSLAGKVGYAGKYSAFGIELRYVSQQYTDTANTQSDSIPPYLVMNAEYRLTASENIQFTLALKNILNALYYTQQGYPMPPFSVETGVRLHW
jgi:outer membrane receptor protein involved in Fe transport